MNRLTVLLCGAFLGAATVFAQVSTPPDPWTRLSFLVGDWEGVGNGAPGEAVGRTSFAFSLDKRILVRKNWAKYPPKPGETSGISHEDLLIIYPVLGPSGFRAIYFDNEGHVVNYLVLFPPQGGGVVFETEAGEGAPRYRLKYVINADGILKNAFSIAPPGKEFKVYVEGDLKKKR